MWTAWSRRCSQMPSREATSAMGHGGPTAPIVSFLSDYGLLDEFVGVCHGVIASRCPRARVIDLTHSIAPQDVRAGAFALRGALPFVPAGVHLAVVDPGVGSARRAVAMRTAVEDRLLVGPDNGLLMLAAERFAGVSEVVDVGRSPVRLEPVSSTFHGRDIFAPVAAALAAGAALRELGEPLDVAELHRLELPTASFSGGRLTTHAVHGDGFGNVVLDASPEQLAALGGAPGDTVTVRHGELAHTARLGRTFAAVEPGALLLYADAQGAAALAVNLGSAVELLGVERDAELVLERA